MAQNHSQSAELPQWLNILIYILLVAILGVVGDLFTFVLGTIGLSIVFVAYFNSKKSEEGH